MIKHFGGHLDAVYGSSMGAFMKRLAKHPEKAMAKFSKIADAKGMSIDEKELKSSGLDDGICVPGTKIHVFYSEKMGDKYLKRYHKDYADPEIISFPCGHEGWLGNPQLMIETFHRCMKAETKTR